MFHRALSSYYHCALNPYSASGAPRKEIPYASLLWKVAIQINVAEHIYRDILVAAVILYVLYNDTDAVYTGHALIYTAAPEADFGVINPTQGNV